MALKNTQAQPLRGIQNGGDTYTVPPSPTLIALQLQLSKLTF